MADKSPVERDFTEVAANVTGILHDHIRSARLVDSTLDQVLRLLRPNPFGFAVSDDVGLRQIIDEPVQKLVHALSAFSEREQMLELEEKDSHVRARLQSGLRLLRDSMGRVDASTMYTIGEAAAIVDNILTFLGRHRPTLHLNHERRKALRSACDEVLRLCCLYNLRQAKVLVLATGNELRFALDYLRGRPQPEGDVAYDVRSVILETVDRFRTSASNRAIDIRLPAEPPEAYVTMPTKELQMALGNLLDNAIKYTGRLASGSRYERPWIAINLVVTPHAVTVAVESWGTPITVDELESGNLFKASARGHFVDKTTVPGTGTGLFYVKTVTQRYGGDAVINTRPLSPHMPPVPTTTTVSLLLRRAPRGVNEQNSGR
jgi:signal transduction histidine kinase